MTTASPRPTRSPGSPTPKLSRDGRFLAFYSTATNLVAGDTNGRGDIFVHDRSTASTERRSLGVNGEQPDNHADMPVISADGQVVVFASLAANLVLGDSNGRAMSSCARRRGSSWGACRHRRRLCQLVRR